MLRQKCVTNLNLCFGGSVYFAVNDSLCLFMHFIISKHLCLTVGIDILKLTERRYSNWNIYFCVINTLDSDIIFMAGILQRIKIIVSILYTYNDIESEITTFKVNE